MSPDLAGKEKRVIMRSMKKKRILLLYTGGTIGMVPGPKGYVPDSAEFIRRLHDMDELNHPDMPEWNLIEFSPLLDSSNITVKEWNQMGRTIAVNYDDYDGFVVLHGTDTMAYSASALSFMLENLNKPVIFTGAQIPLCEIRSDARENLVNAMVIASSNKVHEVCLYFAGKLMRGNRAVKRSSDRFEAFDSPNAPLLAEAGIAITYNDAELLPATDMELELQPFEEVPIGVIKVFPGIQFELFESIMTEKLKGVVLETFGCGNIPGYQNSLLSIIQKAYESGTILTITSQCPQGTVSVGTYEVSSSLSEVDAVGGKDMTTEAAVAKLYYLFSRYTNKALIKAKMEENLRGELTTSRRR